VLVSLLDTIATTMVPRAGYRADVVIGKMMSVLTYVHPDKILILADIQLKLDLDVDLHKRSPSGPHKFTNYYADRTPCWVDGRRGWMKDHTCGDLVRDQI
jgi:hypothetical protein